MATTRELTAATPGPIRFDVSTKVGTVRITSNALVKQATVTVSTQDDEGAFADAVNNADITERAGTLAVKLTGPDNADTFIFNGGGVHNVISGNVAGMVFQDGNVGGMSISGNTISVGGRIIVQNGRTVVPQGTQVNAGPGHGTITIDVQLPPGSEVNSSTTSADLTLTGTYTILTASTVSGDISAASTVIDTVSINTTSGDIELDHLRNGGMVHSVSGDIELGAYDGGMLNVTTVSGDIRATATTEARTGHVNLNTTSGDITTERFREDGALRVNTNTVSGRVRRR